MKNIKALCNLKRNAQLVINSGDLQVSASQKKSQVISLIGLWVEMLSLLTPPAKRLRLVRINYHPDMKDDRTEGSCFCAVLINTFSNQDTIFTSTLCQLVGLDFVDYFHNFAQCKGRCINSNPSGWDKTPLLHVGILLTLMTFCLQLWPVRYT